MRLEYLCSMYKILNISDAYIFESNDVIISHINWLAYFGWAAELNV